MDLIKMDKSLLTSNILSKIDTDEELFIIFQDRYPLPNTIEKSLQDDVGLAYTEGWISCIDGVFLWVYDGDSYIHLNSLLNACDLEISVNLGFVKIEEAIYCIDEFISCNKMKIMIFSRLFIPSHKKVNNPKSNMYQALIMSNINDCRSEISKENSEKEKLKLFKERNTHNLKFLDITSDTRHMPDDWIDLHGKKAPLEAKKGFFDKKALKQLLRYMDFYGCDNGVAVGSKLSVKIPGNILFYDINS